MTAATLRTTATATRSSDGATLGAPEAAARLGDWGFLAHPDLPDTSGPAFLIVSIPPRPTLRHFDPESVQYWRTVDGRGTAAVLDRDTPLPLEQPFSWGEIRVLDRFRISNEYVTFGGTLRADRVGEAAVAVLTSAAPLLRRGGHSQLADQAAADVAAFFARLLVEIGVRPGLERQVGNAAPLALYSAFLEDAADRLARYPGIGRARPDFANLVGRERRRLTASDETKAGHDMLVAAGLADERSASDVREQNS
jgi:hypothetical protein